MPMTNMFRPDSEALIAAWKKANAAHQGANAAWEKAIVEARPTENERLKERIKELITLIGKHHAVREMVIGEECTICPPHFWHEVAREFAEDDHA